MSEVADVLIVGGGPAGLATAIRARQAGLTATVLERGQPGRDKACGEGLMPDAVARLEALGVALGHRGMPFAGIRYLDGDGDGGLVAEGRFPAGVHGRGVRRPALHLALAERARAVGVDLRWGTRVRGLAPGWEAGDCGAVDTATGPVAGRWLVAADGLHSPLRRQAGLAAPERSASPAELKPGGTARFGVRRHIQRAPWTDLVEVHWGPRCEAYVTPVSGEEVSVAILWSGGKATFDDLLGRFPRLTGRLGGASALHRDQGCGPLRQRSRGVYRQRLALVGDATGYLDALTGEGLALALHQAFALVEAIRAGRLAGYRRSCRRIARVPDGFTAAMLWVERRPAWRRRLLRALGTEPGLFDRFLAIHGGCAPVSSLGFEGVVRLLRGLLVTPKVSGAEYGIHGH